MRSGGDELNHASEMDRHARDRIDRAGDDPLWAGTQNNPANAQSHQGTRTDGPAGADLLAQAVAACTAALEVRTRSDHPEHWAMTRENLAQVERALVDRDATGGSATAYACSTGTCGGGAGGL